MGRSSDARIRLIEAARSIIFARSYKGVSVEELCIAANVNKSSFYHFFASKQELVLAAIDRQWQLFDQSVLAPTFSENIPPQEQILQFFDRVIQFEQDHKLISGYMRGCPAGNLTLEMSSQDEMIRKQVEHFFQGWLQYFEQMLYKARELEIISETLDIKTTALALLAYFEGVLLLARSRNDPTLIATLRPGALSLMQYQEKKVKNTQQLS